MVQFSVGTAENAELFYLPHYGTELVSHAAHQGFVLI